MTAHGVFTLVGNEDQGRWDVAGGGPEINGPPPALLGWLLGRSEGIGAAYRWIASRDRSMAMSYHGHVQPGSPQTRELPGLVITKASVGSMDNNAYFLRCPETGQTALIDAAAEPETLLAIVGDGPLGTIITTHQHQDHWSALERRGQGDAAPQPSQAPMTSTASRSRTDRAVGDGDRIEFGGVSLEVIHIVGHTPGSICLLYDDPTGPPHLWTGDSLFPGGVGTPSER